METVITSVKKTGRVLIAHEDYAFLGLGGEIAIQIMDAAFEFLDAPIRRLGSKFAPIPFADPLERAVLPGEHDIRAAILELLHY
jgi:pyruvate/2-oxoglutarate/acetoin dehydrogenase E1 component